DVPRYRRRVVRAGGVLGRVRQVVGLVAVGRAHQRALGLGEPDGPPFRYPDRPLPCVVAAVEQPRVGEVAVVGDVDVVGAGPHERAHHGLGEEESVGIAGLDARQLHVGRDAADTHGVLGSRDNAGGVGAVPVVVHPRCGVGVRGATDTGRAVREVDVRRDVRVGEVQAGVDVSDYDVRATATDGV